MTASRHRPASEGSGRIRAASADELRGPLRDALVELYTVAYRYDADSERVRRFPGLIDTFSAQPDFCAQVSIGPDGRPDGMSFGYTTGAGRTLVRVRRTGVRARGAAPLAGRRRT